MGSETMGEGSEAETLDSETIGQGSEAVSHGCENMRQGSETGRGFSIVKQF